MSQNLALFDFQKALALALDRVLPDHTHTKLQDKLKNNGITLHGICIMNPDSNVSPIFYIDTYYDQYTEGRDITDITSEIAARYDECAIIAEDIFDDFSDYEKIKNNIVYHVVNTELNRERIANAPTIPFLDLSVVFYVVMNDAFQSGEVMIENSHLAIWENVDTERLMIDAAKNTPRLFPYRLCGLLDQCLDLNNPDHEELTLTNEDLLEHIFKTPDIESDPAESMLILTTAGLTSGACTLLYTSILAKIAEAFDRDLVIIPSSINELIVLPKIEGTDINGINATVREVNESHVDPVEVLSDHVYEFRRSLQCVTY